MTIYNWDIWRLSQVTLWICPKIVDEVVSEHSFKHLPIYGVEKRCKLLIGHLDNVPLRNYCHTLGVHVRPRWKGLKLSEGNIDLSLLLRREHAVHFGWNPPWCNVISEGNCKQYKSLSISWIPANMVVLLDFCIFMFLFSGLSMFLGNIWSQVEV